MPLLVSGSMPLPTCIAPETPVATDLLNPAGRKLTALAAVPLHRMALPSALPTCVVVEPSNASERPYPIGCSKVAVYVTAHAGRGMPAVLISAAPARNSDMGRRS